MSQGIALPGGGLWWGETSGLLWAENGGTALPEAHTREEAEEYVRRYQLGEFFCSGCLEWHQGPYAFRRFAGVFCASAAERYKGANARTCGLCLRPIYECCC